MSNFILEFSSYDSEPLHILIDSAINSGLAMNPKEICNCLSNLCNKSYIECSWHSLEEFGEYIKIDALSLDQLIEYINKNRKFNFKEYPKEGGEYFFKTTEAGIELIPEDYEHPE